MNQPFERDILQELGLDALPPAEQEAALVNIGRIIYQGVLLRVMDQMSDEDKDEFEKLLEDKNGDQEAIFGFLQKKVPDLDAIVEQEVQKFRRESSDLLRQIKDR